MPKPQDSPQYLDSDHEAISTFAETYFDDPDERESFVTELMTRRGYTPRTRTDWEPPAEPDPKPGGGRGGGAAPRRPSYFKQSSAR